MKHDVKAKVNFTLELTKTHKNERMMVDRF